MADKGQNGQKWSEMVKKWSKCASRHGIKNVIAALIPYEKSELQAHSHQKFFGCAEAFTELNDTFTKRCGWAARPVATAGCQKGPATWP